MLCEVPTRCPAHAGLADNLVESLKLGIVPELSLMSNVFGRYVVFTVGIAESIDFGGRFCATLLPHDIAINALTAL